jgi:hypothetical protein
MKTTTRLLTLTFLMGLSSCIAQKEIDTKACQDPKYLHLLTIPIDSMSARDFAYFQMKDKECEDATAAANAVEQQQVGSGQTTALTAILAIVGGVLVVLLSDRTIR